MDPDVEAWLRDTNPTLAPAMRRMAEIIIAADPRLMAYPKFGTVHFAFLSTAVPRSRASSRTSRAPARLLRFADLDEVEERAGQLAAIARGWCELVG